MTLIYLLKVLPWMGVFFSTLLVSLYLARHANELGLLAEPGAHRQHEHATPMVGGLAMYVGLLIGFFTIDNSFAMLLPPLFLLTIVGTLDDRYSLPSWARFAVQGAAAYLMIKLTGVQLSSLGYLSPSHDVLLGKWSIPLTIFATIGVINAINMSDGLDGLAAAMVALVLLGLLISGVNQSLVLILLVSVLAFLSLNARLLRQHARIFMGDAGSTMLGLALTYLLIKTSQTPNSIWPVTALWLLALPLIDAVAVLLVRPIRGKSPFAADRLHYHHQLLDRGVSVNVTLLVSVLIQSGFIGLGLVARHVRVAEHLQLVAFLLVFVGYFSSLLWFSRKTRDQKNYEFEKRR